MIRRVLIENYKSLKKTEVNLSPLTIIFGPNASGKSNLFDAIQLVSRLVTSKNIRDAFLGHRGLPLECVHYNSGSIADLEKKDWHVMAFEIDVELSQTVIDETERYIQGLRKGLVENDGPDSAIVGKKITNPHLRYRIELEVSGRTGQARVKNEKFLALRRTDSKEKARGAFIEKVEKNKLSLRMEGQARPTNFDLGLDSTVISSDLYAPHYPHIAAFKEEMRRCHSYYFEPRKLMRAGNAIADVTNIGSQGDDLAAFYYTLQERNPLQFKNLKKNAANILPRLTDITLDKRPTGEIFIESHEGNARYSNTLISEGTLRILGLLAVLSPTCGSTTIGYEEPENGVHPRRLAQISELLKTASSQQRQILVNTHSATLASYFENDHLMVCKRDGEQTCFQTFRSLGPLFRSGEIDRNLEEQIIRGDYGG